MERKRFVLHFIVMLGLASCGSEQLGNVSNEIPDNEQAQVNENSSTSETETLKNFYDDGASAQLVQDLPQAGPCDPSRYRDLIYVIELSSFFYCNDQTSWTAIELKGPKGETGVQGVQGPQGVAGRDGAAGRDGVAGQDGVDGEDAPSITASEWLDPVSDQKWFAGEKMRTWDAAGEVTLCPTGSRSPTSAEMTSAIQSGILTKLVGSGSQFNGQSYLYVNVVTEANNGNTRFKLYFVNTGTVPYTIQMNQIYQSDFDGGVVSGFWANQGYPLCLVTE